MKQQEIDYCKIMALGFKEQKTYDSVYKRQYGYDYVIISKKLCKGVYVSWTKHDRTCELTREGKEGKIKGRLPIRDLDHLIEVIDFFKGDVITKKVTFKKGVTKFESVKNEIKA